MKPRVILRIALGVYFIVMGMIKLLGVEQFMSALDGYGIPSPFPLNLIAILIPTLELVCGLALALHRFWRSALLILILLMVCFSAVIFWRMNAIHALEGLPRCAVSFDCGCGNGAVNACRKIAINVLTLVLMVCVFRTKTWPNSLK